jgi:chromosome segregation ATPase
MLVTFGQGYSGSESILDIVKDAARYTKELEDLKKARKDASDAFIKLSQGKDAQEMLEEAKQIKQAALKERQNKIAEAEAYLNKMKEEAKVLKGDISKRRDDLLLSEKKVASIMDETLQMKKEAEALFLSAEKKARKAETEYAAALQIKKEWTDKVQDLKQRLKGII